MSDPFVGPAKRLEDLDLPRIGYRIGCGEDELHAFMDVEAAGSGFDKLNRPKMLFEPHVFYRNLKGAERQEAVNKGLAYPKWKPGMYPKDSYPRLIEAIEINQTAALKSASWGLGQILGENHAAAGYESPQAMVEDFTLDEENHLEAMVQFLVSNSLDDDLRDHNWEGLARGYNGPAYKVHAYDRRLAEAYRKWAKIVDTPWQPGAGLPKPDIPEAEIVEGAWPEDALTPDEIKTIQAKLITLGYAPGRVDGVWGPNTSGAISAFQTVNSLTVDGHWGPETRKRLFSPMALRNPLAPLPEVPPVITPGVPPVVPPTLEHEVDAIVAGLLPILLAKLAPIIVKEVVKAIKEPETALESAKPIAAANLIADSVVQDLKAVPEIAHITNQEPWYKSRVTWGAIVSALAGILAVLGITVTPEGIDALTGTLLGLGAVIGGCVTLYGRWQARVPIGEHETSLPET